jgi:hydrogenase maturation protease
MDIVIGVGNTLRRDDGLGPFIATAVPPMPGVETLAVHQLTADLIEQVSRARRVLFIDASTTDEEIRLKRITEKSAPPGHVFGPAALLGLARGIHGTSPEGWLLPVPGYDFDFGEELSSRGAKVVPTAVDAVMRWIEEGMDDETTQSSDDVK